MMLKSQQIGELVGVMGDPMFSDAYQTFCKNWVGSDANFVFIFPRRSQPRIRATSLDADNRSHEMYFDGRFKGDDGVRRCGTIAKPHVRVVNAKRDHLDEFQQELYQAGNISYLVTVSARLENSICYIGFCRREGRMFTDGEIEEIYNARQLMLPLVRRHDELLLLQEARNVFAPGPDRSGNLDVCARAQTVKRIAATFAEGTLLSIREAEVCALTMLGYSMEGASLELDVSICSIATYRRRAFEKLGIAGGSELFETYRMCLDRLTSAVSGYSTAPTTG